MSAAKVAFVTNICPHYRVRTFEVLAKSCQVDYYFFSAGDDWYWQQRHGVRAGDFHYEYLRGFRLGRTRITPALPQRLWLGAYDAFLKCINGRFALPMTYCIARAKRKPFILWTGIWRHPQTLVHRLSHPIVQYIYQHADAIVVYGAHVKRYLISEGVQAERVFIAAHAVDNDFYSQPVPQEKVTSLRERLSIAPDEKVILFLGRLETCKGISFLIEALSALRHHKAVLVLAGDGADRQALEALVSQFGVQDQVRFAGYVPMEDTVPYYAMAWACVLPSITTPTVKELWGLVVNEAFNQGVPLIASDAVGAVAGGLVRDGINGLVVPEKNPGALAAALQRVIEHPALREEMSQNARSTIARWDQALMVQGFQRAIDYGVRANSGKRGSGAQLEPPPVQDQGSETWGQG